MYVKAARTNSAKSDTEYIRSKGSTDKEILHLGNLNDGEIGARMIRDPAIVDFLNTHAYQCWCPYVYASMWTQTFFKWHLVVDSPF